MQTEVETLGKNKKFGQVLQEFVDGENLPILQEIIKDEKYSDKTDVTKESTINYIKLILANNILSKDLEGYTKYTKGFLLEEYNKVIAEMKAVEVQNSQNHNVENED